MNGLRLILLLTALCFGSNANADPHANADPAAASGLPRCLFVSSYHQGYQWSDGVERGLRKTLRGQCELRQFDMDSKRRKKPEQIRDAARQALSIIDAWRPDVVIVADDNAAKYLVEPHLNNTDLPVVFCGINWSAEEYGFPSPNVTGMIEIAPVRQMLERGRALTGGGQRALYLGAATLTEEKNVARLQAAATPLGLRLDIRLVADAERWLQAYRDGQEYDFIVLGSNAGIAGWDETSIRREVAATTRRLAVTSHGWMMPYAQFGMTKVPEEQGAWSGLTALAIVRDGMSPRSIPVVANRQWDYWANESLLQRAQQSLPAALKRRARRAH